MTERDDVNILVVDDEANIRLTLRAALESDGYSVREAGDGRAALDAIVQHRPALVLLDLSMPTMDGMTFLARLRELPSADRPPVVVLTAYGSIEAAVRAMKLGARDFVEKPVTPDDVRAVVESALTVALLQSDPASGPSYDDVLNLIRQGLRGGRFHDVESMLMRAGMVAPHDDAEFLNLAGVFHEAMRRPDDARRFYGRAIRVGRGYEPAQQNMRRLYELGRFGHTKQQVALGDEQHLLDRVPARSREPGLLPRLRRLLIDEDFEETRKH